MAEMNVVGKHVNVHPLHGVIRCPAFPDGEQLCGLSLDLRMTVHAGLSRRDIGVSRNLDVGVTILAVQPQLANMKRVTIRNRLLGLVADVRVFRGEVIPDKKDGEHSSGCGPGFLLHRSHRVAPGDWLLIYAAAGGVGSLLVQWAASLGAHVIGIVGSQAKRELALKHGCEHVLISTDDVVAGVESLTAGRGVAAVYDSVGRETFIQSLDCLAPHGVMVSYGNASGPVEPVSPLELMRRGSLFLTRPSLFDFIGDRELLETGARDLFARVLAGELRVDINQRFALRHAAAAHRALEGRQTTGATVLEP